MSMEWPKEWSENWSEEEYDKWISENHVEMILSTSELKSILHALIFDKETEPDEKHDIAMKIIEALRICMSEPPIGKLYFTDKLIINAISMGWCPEDSEESANTVERFFYEVSENPETGEFYTMFHHPTTHEQMIITGETEQDVIKKADWLSDITPPEGVSNF